MCAALKVRRKHVVADASKRVGESSTVLLSEGSIEGHVIDGCGPDQEDNNVRDRSFPAL